MKFTIERRALIRMVEQMRGKMPGRRRGDVPLKLWACAARVFVTSGGEVAGYEALVFEDGECVVPGRRFSRILKTYKGKKNLTIEVDEKALCQRSVKTSQGGSNENRPH